MNPKEEMEWGSIGVMCGFPGLRSVVGGWKMTRLFPLEIAFSHLFPHNLTQVLIPASGDCSILRGNTSEARGDVRIFRVKKCDRSGFYAEVAKFAQIRPVNPHVSAWLRVNPFFQNPPRLNHRQSRN